MARFPREEIDYKKLYKKINLDRNLGIDWPIVEEATEIIVVNEDLECELQPSVYLLDEFDEEFCKENEISESFCREILEILEKNYLEMIFTELDNIENEKEFEYCDICGKTDDEDSNPMMICQGCLISVHEDCYGTVESPGDRWLCKKCIFYFEDGCCSFCSKKSGILKKTENNEWGHVICTLLNPTLSFCNLNIRDPIEIIDLVKMEGNCSICNENSSHLIKCAFEGCNTFYHGSCCAEIFYCDLNNAITYCDHHNPLIKNKKILSKRNKLRSAEAYPELVNRIMLRVNRKLITPIKAEYLKIVKQEPKIVLKGLEKVLKNENFDKICTFWKEKKMAFDFYFQDIFILSNRFLMGK